jgi:hypothetical protein
MPTHTEAWTFNRDYSDLSQVIPFIDEYWAILDELRENEQYPYNAAFEGKIDGITGLEREETPIFLLQQLRHLVEGHDHIAKLLGEGYTRLLQLGPNETRRFECATLFDAHLNPSRYAEARVISREDGQLRALLPKGKRTHGRLIMDNEILFTK